MNTRNTGGNTRGVNSTSTNRGRKWLIILIVLAIFLVIGFGIFSALKGRSKDAPTETPSGPVVCQDWRQWDGFQGRKEGRIGQFEDSQHLNIQVVDGKPLMATNKYPVSSDASKEEFLNLKRTGVIGMMTFIVNYRETLALYGFDLEVSTDYHDYVVLREDGFYYLNEKGCELANAFAEVINNDLVEVRLIWIDRDLAALLGNANNTDGYVSYSPLINSISRNMTAWEVKFYKANDDGTKTEVVVETARQLTRCGNLTPEKPGIPLKKAPAVQPEGDDNFAGKPDNPGNPPAKPGVVDPPKVDKPVDPGVKPDDPYKPDPGSGGDDYVPPKPTDPEKPVIKKPDPEIPKPDVVVPTEPDRDGDPGGF